MEATERFGRLQFSNADKKRNEAKRIKWKSGFWVNSSRKMTSRYL